MGAREYNVHLFHGQHSYVQIFVLVRSVFPSQ